MSETAIPAAHADPASPPPGDAAATAWRVACAVADIPAQGARVVAVAGRPEIAVFRTLDDRVFALVDRCPHKGGPLSAGVVHGHAVTCPLHNWAIGLADGRAREPDEGCARTVPARVEGGMVWLAVETG